MPVMEVLLIALALSIDAMAVAVAGGAGMKELETRNALKMGLFFGGFQALMPVAGWLAGVGMKSFIAGVDHWIAFVLLALVGSRMIWESARLKDADCRPGKNCFDTGTLFILAIATSIDALAVGVTFSVLSVPVIGPSLLIGLVTFSLTVAGVRIGVKGGHFFENRMELAGGLVLIVIGVKILLDHLAG